MIRSTNLLQVFKRLTTFDKSLNVIKNGADNLYPERVDRYINNSVTAKNCARIMSSYLIGYGFGDINNKVIVNKKTKLELEDFGTQIAQSFSKQRGVWIHVNYNLKFQPASYSVLPYMDCRIGEKDDDDYHGKILVSKDWESTKKKDVEVFDVFNPDPNVIKAQIQKAKGKTVEQKMNNYKGQILYVSLEEDYIYSLSQVDPVLKDCDSEAQASVFKNGSLRKGFYGKQMVFTKALAGTLEDHNGDQKAWMLEQNERDNFKETMQDFVGAENNGGILHVELEHDSDNFDAEVKFVNIDSNINDKLFEYTENSVFENILMSFNSIPKGLIRPDNGVFGGSSGQAIDKMMLTYQNNTRNERRTLERTIIYLMSIFVSPVNNLELIPLVEEKTEETETEETEPQKA